ncbi:LCP family protein [Trueperella pyogenes]|uniref:LCP family protein n=1 Tax=Trueperella pyogenes TaxID=1661 RepID=UPI0032534F1C
MNQPPSFEPRKRVQRPSSDGARPVGQGHTSQAPRRGGRPSAVNSPSALGQQLTPRPEPGLRPEPASGPARRPSPIRRSAFAGDERARTSPPDATRAYTQMPPAIPPAFAPQNARVAEDQPVTPAAQPRTRRKRPVGKIILAVILVLLIAVVSWAFYLYSYGNGRLTHVKALSGAPATPGTTYLIVGSDERGEAVNDPTEGHRADTIMLLHKPESGPAALVSLPRDTLVRYPESTSSGKLNASFARGGAAYLVQTVEKLTGLTIDRYIQIGMDGVKNLTDAVGGVELCLDYDVDDEFSGLNWTAGCHLADGTTALAFSRMRYSDPLGDIGRTERQRQVVGKIINKSLSSSTLLNPFAQRKLVGSVADVLTVDDDASLMNIGFAGLSLRETIGPDGLKGAPPIASLNHRGPGGSSTVLLADEAKQFWLDLRDGKLTPNSFASF